MSTHHERMEPRPEPKGDGHLQYLITAYLFENISDAGRREVEGHLAVCAQCRAELAELRATLLQVEDAIAPGAPDAAAYSFEARRLERVLSSARTRGLGGFLRRHRGYLSLAAAALILVAVVFQLELSNFSKSRGGSSERLARRASPSTEGMQELVDSGRAVESRFGGIPGGGGGTGGANLRYEWKDGAGAPPSPAESPPPPAAPAAEPAAVAMLEHTADSNALGAVVTHDFTEAASAGTVAAPSTHLYSMGDEKKNILDLEAGLKPAAERPVSLPVPVEVPQFAVKVAKPAENPVFEDGADLTKQAMAAVDAFAPGLDPASFEKPGAPMPARKARDPDAPAKSEATRSKLRGIVAAPRSGDQPADPASSMASSLPEAKPRSQLASTFARNAKGYKALEEAVASNGPAQRAFNWHTNSTATEDVAARSKERFAEEDIRRMAAEAEKAGVTGREIALESKSLAWDRARVSQPKDGLQVAGAVRESRDAPVDEYFVAPDRGGVEALEKQKDDAKPTPEKAPAPESDRRRGRREADAEVQNRAAGDVVELARTDTPPQAFGQYWGYAVADGIQLQGLGIQDVRMAAPVEGLGTQPVLLARKGRPGGGGGEVSIVSTDGTQVLLELPQIIAQGDFDADGSLDIVQVTPPSPSGPVEKQSVAETFFYKPPVGPQAESERLLGEAQQDGERSLPVRHRAAVETALRGFQHYRSLDPGLKAKAYFAHPATVPAPTVGDEGLGEAGFKARYGVNPFVDTQRDHFSTFGMDVDTASYTLARGALQSGRLPDPKTVRVEEFVNYFREDAAADPGAVFAVRCEGGPSPFGEGLDLLKITVKARDLLPAERKDAVLTFAVDTSGSMNLDNRLALVRGALESLVGSLKPDDRVAIVAFGANPYLVLPHTPARDRERILSAVHSLAPGGGTNVEAGLDLAYRVADEVLEAKAVNRVILCSDGVANVGARGPEEILKKAEVFAKRGIYLSSIGVGRGKYNDAMLETLSKKGNGNYAYVDSPAAAAEIFEKNLPSTLQVLAQDAKIQVDFNADVVSHYRLLGYEKRDIADSDFRNNKVDAGEVGPGSTVTVLYEIRRKASSSGDLGRIYLRYLDTGTGRVDELNYPVPPGVLAVRLEDTSDRFRFIASVAETAELLRGSYWARNGSYGKVESLMNTVSPELQARPEWKEVLDLIARARELTIQKLVSQ